MTLSTKNYQTDSHGWAEFLVSRSAAAPLKGNHNYPWVVIGAGVTGLACARKLAALHPDEEILLLDARLVAQGASGRNSGFAVAHTQFLDDFDEAQRLQYQCIDRINLAGLSLLREEVKQLDIDCQWVEQGYLNAAADVQSKRGYENYRNYLEKLEIAHTCLDKDEMHEQLGTTHYNSGINVHAGALLQPAMLVRGLADNLPENVTLAEQNPVLKVEQSSSPVLHLISATIRTDKLIIATNYEVAKLGRLASRMIGSTLSGSFTRVLIEQELASLGTLQQWGILSLHGGGATMRLTPDGRIMIRNTAEYHGGNLLANHKLESRKNIHRYAFEKRFPQLAHVPFEYSWSCVEGISANGTNFFGELDKNIYYAGGYNGSGVTRGTAFGHALAQYASGGQSALITDCLASPKATWLPPRPLLDIGAYFTVRKRFRGVGLDR